ncbi:MAG: Fe-S cluster assembly protein SufD, partial [Alphaproteobacteria bacterium]|nr:Fe-S cluster assembly protein SufD [Alphaproteobacteria bacterium]
GAVLVIAPDVQVRDPIHLVSITDSVVGPAATHLRTLVVAGAHSRATLVETHAGRDGDRYLTNMAGEIVVGPGARLDHYRLQMEGDEAYHLSSLAGRVAEHGTYDNFTLTLRGALTRNDGHVVLQGPEGDLRYSGAYLGAGSQHVDNTTIIEHASPHCRSREVFKGVLDDAARGVFQGKIVVRPGAQKTDAHQLSNGLLLSRKAEVDAKPELEIFADDVKCSHGATAGEIDHTALFYLRSRGIDEREARALLVEAFVNEALEEIEVEVVRERFMAAVRTWLISHGQKGGQ